MRNTFLAFLMLLLPLIGCSKADHLGVRYPYHDAFEAACTMLINGKENASGVLLNTGYVISAAHIFDINNNGVIDEDEMKNELGVRVFGDKTKRDYKAFIIASGDNYVKNKTEDVVILQLIGENLPRSNVRLATDSELADMKVGDGVFTVGRADSDTQHLTVGVLSTKPKNGRMRMTAEIIFGNSGGGVYSSDTQRLIGIATNLRAREETLFTTVSIPHLDSGGQLLGWITCPVYIRHMDPVGSWGEFVSSKTIRSVIQREGVYRVLDPTSKRRPSEIELVVCLLGVLLMFTGVSWTIFKNS